LTHHLIGKEPIIIWKRQINLSIIKTSIYQSSKHQLYKINISLLITCTSLQWWYPLSLSSHETCNTTINQIKSNQSRSSQKIIRSLLSFWKDIERDQPPPYKLWFERILSSLISMRIDFDKRCNKMWKWTSPWELPLIASWRTLNQLILQQTYLFK